jgi:hypothetical protein
MYFTSARTAWLNRLVNGIFERSPRFRWGARKVLRTVEYPFSFITSYLINDSLPLFSLDIDEQNLLALDQNLPEPFTGETLLPQHKVSVPATLTTEGKKFMAQVRYRGDNYNHWGFKKKSWRVKLLDGEIDGMKVFNFIIPEDRMFIQELFSFRLANRLGLIEPKAGYATLRVNDNLLSRSNR